MKVKVVVPENFSEKGQAESIARRLFEYLPGVEKVEFEGPGDGPWFRREINGRFCCEVMTPVEFSGVEAPAVADAIRDRKILRTHHVTGKSLNFVCEENGTEMAWIAVQINGILYTTIDMPAGVSKDEATRIALGRPGVRRELEEKVVTGITFVPDRLLNLKTRPSDAATLKTIRGYLDGLEAQGKLFSLELPDGTKLYGIDE